MLSLFINKVFPSFASRKKIHAGHRQNNANDVTFQLLSASFWNKCLTHEFSRVTVKTEWFPTQFPGGDSWCVGFANLCYFKVTPNNIASTVWHSGTAGRDHNSKRTECHSASSSAEPEIDFTCSFPSAKMKADEHGCSEAVTAGEEWGAGGGDKTVEVTSDAKEREMSFRLSARTSPPSLPRLLCVSQSGGAGSSQSVTRVLL